MGPEWVRDNVTQSLQFTPANFSARGVARVRQGSGGVGGSGVGAAHEQGALWATQQVDGNGARDLNHVGCCDANAAGSLNGREDGLKKGRGARRWVSMTKYEAQPQLHALSNQFSVSHHPAVIHHILRYCDGGKIMGQCITVPPTKSGDCMSVCTAALTVMMAGHWTSPLFWGKMLKSSSCRMEPLALQEGDREGRVMFQARLLS